jgi:hypothetical protein
MVSRLKGGFEKSKASGKGVSQHAAAGGPGGAGPQPIFILLDRFIS